MSSSGGDSLLRENDQETLESSSQPALDPPVLPKSSHGDGSISRLNEPEPILGRRIGHTPHKSSVFNDELPEHTPYMHFEDYGHGLDNHIDLFDYGRGYGGRGPLNHMYPGGGYLEPMGPIRGHKSTLSGHGLDSDMRMAPLDGPSPAMGRFGMSNRTSELLSEPPLFPDHETINSYTRTPPPFMASYDMPPPGYRLNPPTPFRDPLAGPNHFKPIGSNFGHQHRYSGLPMNEYDPAMPAEFNAGSASQPCSPVPADTIEKMLTSSPIPPGMEVPAKKMPYACRDFRNGKCTRGDNCKFMHVLENFDSGENPRPVYLD